MSYQALYRKFRPETFDDVKGQDAIVTTLVNQLQSGRTGHAYLFCGTRGTGKTTVAKILGRALNCEDLKENGPCGQCAMCRGIKDGSVMNVIEIDAASNNSVDNIRDIIDDVAYRPSRGKYKVYIIDEVHMLSQGAFNALLKTLEEPPAYVVFILATTEAHKIPATILSRCQRYDFKRITVGTITARLLELVAKEEVVAEDKALRYIAKTADGSMRDALSLLDQCMAFYMDKTLTFDRVLDVLGSVDTEIFSRLLKGIRQGDVGETMKTADELVLSGRDLGRVTEDFVWYLRNLLLSKSSDNMEEVLDVTEETMKRMQEEAADIEVESLIRLIRICSEVAAELKSTTQKRVVFEVALIKMCRPQMERHPEALLERIRVLEKAVSDLEKRPVTCVADAAEKVEDRKPVEQKALPDAIPRDIQEVAQKWSKIMQDVPNMFGTVLREAHVGIGGGKQLLIIGDSSFSMGFLKGKEEEIEALIRKDINRDVSVRLVSEEERKENRENYFDLTDLMASGAINIDIVEED